MLLLACAVSAQAPVQQERIAASFVLALGRTPTAAEMERWEQEGAGSVADLLARHRQQLQADAAAERAVIVKASQDALGMAPGEEEIKAQPESGVTYTDAMQRHLARLADDTAGYEQVLHRAYRRVLQRDAYDVEIVYWKRRPVLSFAMLTACVDDWARRNQPGLMATAGVAAASINSPYLASVRLSPAVAAEARAAAGLAPAGDPRLAVAAGRNIIAPGAASVVSVGGIHFAAAGAVAAR